MKDRGLGTENGVWLQRARSSDTEATEERLGRGGRGRREERQRRSCPRNTRTTRKTEMGSGLSADGAEERGGRRTEDANEGTRFEVTGNAVGAQFGGDMSQGETEKHRRLKVLAHAWAREQGFAISASEVRVPKSGYRADVAACSRGDARRTAVFECKQARADLLKDARREEEARAKVGELGERLKKLEELIGGHRPDLRKGEALFPEFDAWDFSGLDHATHRKVVAELATWQERLLSGTKFAKLWRWRAADYFYLVSEEGIFAEAEVPAGWGLLVRQGEGLALIRRPVWTEASEAQRVALLENIALVATRGARAEGDEGANDASDTGAEAGEAGVEAESD